MGNQAYEAVKAEFWCPKRQRGADSMAPDRWVLHPNGKERTCSYCGGIHPDDVVPVLKAAADPIDLTRIDWTTKPDKFYLKRPGVKNAGDGAIKSYGGHGLPTGFTYDEFVALLREASKGSKAKWEIYFEKSRQDLADDRKKAGEDEFHEHETDPGNV